MLPGGVQPLRQKEIDAFLRGLRRGRGRGDSVRYFRPHGSGRYWTLHRTPHNTLCATAQRLNLVKRVETRKDERVLDDETIDASGDKARSECICIVVELHVEISSRRRRHAQAFGVGIAEAALQQHEFSIGIAGKHDACCREGIRGIAESLIHLPRSKSASQKRANRGAEAEGGNAATYGGNPRKHSIRNLHEVEEAQPPKPPRSLGLPP